MPGPNDKPDAEGPQVAGALSGKDAASPVAFSVVGQPVEFRVLGPLDVVVGKPVTITRPARRRLLSILLLERGRDQPVARLIDRMWGDAPPGDPRNSLQAHVAGLRSQIGDVICSTPDGYRLDVGWLDVDEFERLAGETDGDPAARISSAEAALALWRDDPFPVLADDGFARGAIDALTGLRFTVMVRRIDALLEAGRVEDAIPDLEQLVEANPFEERLWERLMVARHRVGNTVGALRAFQDIRARLGSELGLEPGDRLRSLEERILLLDPTLGSVSRVSTPHNLSSSGTSFVGREDDSDAVVKLLTDFRLVTVTGGPGIGKTRLASEAGHRMLSETPGGVWLVRLVGCGSAPDVAATVAAAMGIADDTPDLTSLGEMLTSRPAILILDNCEHVLDPVRILVEAAMAVDGPLRILATSRQRLAMTDEQVWRVGPLDVPDGADDSVFESEAVRLLIDRVMAVDRTFRIRDTHPALLSELCRRTDGIPLAIELAASWLPSVGVRDAISVATGVVTDGVGAEDHHGPLHAAVDWSLALLTDRGRQLVARAAVFRGSFSLDAFHAVCAPDVSRALAVGAVARLVESSLLILERGEGGATRYRMLEPVREHVRLHQPDDDYRLEDAHADWFRRRAEELGAEISQETDPARAQAEVDLQLADHRAALRHLLDAGQAEEAALLATSLTNYWFARYLGWEATRWLDEAMDGELSDSVRVAATWTAGWAAFTRAEYDVAIARYEECRRLAQQIGDRSHVAWALYGLGRIDESRRPEQGRRLLEEAAAMFEEMGDDRGRAECHLAIGYMAALGGDTSEAPELLSSALASLQLNGLLRSISICRQGLSMVGWYSDNPKDALSHADAAVELARRSDDRPATCGALVQRAVVRYRWGDPRDCATDLLDAMRMLPPRNDIDSCLVLSAASGLLLDAGRPDLTCRVIDHVERVTRAAGWVPIAEWLPALDELRRTACAQHDGEPSTAPATTVSIGQQVKAVLETFVQELFSGPS